MSKLAELHELLGEAKSELLVHTTDDWKYAFKRTTKEYEVRQILYALRHLEMKLEEFHEVSYRRDGPHA